MSSEAAGPGRGASVTGREPGNSSTKLPAPLSGVAVSRTIGTPSLFATSTAGEDLSRSMSSTLP